MRSGSNHQTLNEEEAISLIWQEFSRSKMGLDPFQDDVSWLRNSIRKKFLVIKSDMFVSETDAPPQMTPKQMGSKALVSCVSDFAAKGVRPLFALITLAVSKKLSTRPFILSLAKGLAETSRLYGVKIIGGDTNSLRSGVVIDCTLVGFADKIVKRRNARPGDFVGVTGGFGIQSAGLKILIEKARATSHFRKKAINSVLNPKPRLKLGLEISKYLTSCIDSSDGLAISLYHIAESSGVNLDLKEIPFSPGVFKFAEENSLEPKELALFGGEEYELVFTFGKKFKDLMRRKRINVIGKVLSTSKVGLKPAVSFNSRPLVRKGWIHNC